jgi:hypothetical protein
MQKIPIKIYKIHKMFMTIWYFLLGLRMYVSSNVKNGKVIKEAHEYLAVVLFGSNLPSLHLIYNHVCPS